MAQARRDDDPYERALTDPGFLRAVTAAYRGNWPVLDALWWSGHPTETAPSGSPSPATRLSTLQHRLFGADGDAAGDETVAEAARTLQGEIAAERAALDAALAAARAGATPVSGVPLPASAPPGSALPASAWPPESAPSTRAAGPDDADPAHPDPADADPGEDPNPSDAGQSPDRPFPRRRLLLGAALAGALLVGALVGTQVTAVNRPGAQAPTSTASPSPSPVPVIAAQVFARVQTDQDIPRVALPAAYDPASFRYLGAAGWRDSDANGITDSPYYAARGAENMVCLVVVPERAGYLTTCTPEEDFPASGLRLSWQSTDFLPMEQDDRAMVMDITVAWLSDSTIETRGSGRSLIP